MSPEVRLSRRRLLAGVSGLAVLSVGGLPLAGCSRATTSKEGGSSGPVTLPRYQPPTGVRPELPGTATGVPDGYLSYPAEPFEASSGTPGSGTAVTALFSSFAVSPAPAPRNTYLAELNTRVGADLQLQVTPAPDYPAKLATTVTGELPDVLEILPTQAQLPQLLRATCADLTDHLSGDAVNAYPNLAAFTNDMWRTVIFDNRIFGLPVPRPVQSGAAFIRTDLFEQRGLDPKPMSWEEFVQLCRDLTDARKGQYALSQPPIAYLTGALGGPNEWVDQDGSLVRLQETEQFRQALMWCAELNQQGLIHPDAFAVNATTLGKQRLVGGQVGIHPDGFSAWGSLARFLPAEQQNSIGALPVVGFAGATPTFAVGAGSTNFTAIKKADDGRVVELLKIMNYLSAPFGSKEFLFRKYGNAGTQHTVVDGNPTLTKQGMDEITPVTEGFDYHLADGVKVAYEGSLRDITRAKYEFAKAAEPGYVRSSVIGLYSDTYSRTNSTFARTMTDLQNGVITGRATIGALQEALASWNAGDGKKIKEEFSAARAAQ